MIPNPVLVLLSLGIAVDTALSHVRVWGPPLAAVALALAVRTVADGVRARVRTVSALCLLDSKAKPLTCTDICPDMSVDLCPGLSGPVTDGGC